MEDRKVAAFDVVTYGIEHLQYWQGAGVVFTNWDECYIGIGESEREAVDDALENAATDTWDMGSFDVDLSEFSDTQNVHDGCYDEFRREYPEHVELDNGEIEDTDEWEQFHQGCELHHYAVVYLREATNEEAALP